MLIQLSICKQICVEMYADGWKKKVFIRFFDLVGGLM